MHDFCLHTIVLYVSASLFAQGREGTRGKIHQAESNIKNIRTYPILKWKEIEAEGVLSLINVSLIQDRRDNENVLQFKKKKSSLLYRRTVFVLTKHLSLILDSPPTSEHRFMYSAQRQLGSITLSTFCCCYFSTQMDQNPWPKRGMWLQITPHQWMATHKKRQQNMIGSGAKPDKCHLGQNETMTIKSELKIPPFW